MAKRYRYLFSSRRDFKQSMMLIFVGGVMLLEVAAMIIGVRYGSFVAGLMITSVITLVAIVVILMTPLVEWASRDD